MRLFRRKKSEEPPVEEDKMLPAPAPARTVNTQDPEVRALAIQWTTAIARAEGVAHELDSALDELEEFASARQKPWLGPERRSKPRD